MVYCSYKPIRLKWTGWKFLYLHNISQLSSSFVLPYSGRTCSHPIQADEKSLSVSHFVSFSETLHKTKFHSFLRDNSITVHNWNLFEAFDFVTIASNANACHQKLQNHFSLVLPHLLSQSFQLFQNQIFLLSTCTTSMLLKIESTWSNWHKKYLHHNKRRTKYYTTDLLVQNLCTPSLYTIFLYIIFLYTIFVQNPGRINICFENSSYIYIYIYYTTVVGLFVDKFSHVGR